MASQKNYSGVGSGRAGRDQALDYYSTTEAQQIAFDIDIFSSVVYGQGTDETGNMRDIRAKAIIDFWQEGQITNF